MLLFMKALRMLGRQYFRPRYANLAFPIKSADARLLEERLGCRVNGKASANAIAFPVDALDSPVPTSDRVLFSMLGSCMPQLRVASRSGFRSEERRVGKECVRSLNSRWSPVS